MQIHKLSPPNKTDAMQTLDSYTHDLTAEAQSGEPAIAQNNRGRGSRRKDLSTVEDELDESEDVASLKIKLTLPPSFRRRPVESSSGDSRRGNRPGVYATTQKAAPKRGRPRKNKNTAETDEYAPPRGFKRPKPVTTGSAPSRQPHDYPLVYHPSADHSTQSRFPTFVPASVLSSDDLSGTEDSELSEPESDPDDLIARDKPRRHDRAHTHRELLGNNQDDSQIPTRTPWKHNRHTNSNRHTPILRAQPDDDVRSESSGNEQDGEESSEATEDEADPDPDADADPAAPVQVKSLSDDEDDQLDAQLFFRNLIESSDEAESDADSIMGDIIGAVAAFSDTETDVEQLEQPLMVKEGWDGQLVFSTDILPTAGMLDFDFERSRPQLEDHSQPESLTTSHSTLPVTQPAAISDEDFDEIDSIAGDTTDDEIIPSSVPALPVSSTISPSVTLTPTRMSTRVNMMPPPPSPAELLAARRSFPWDVLASPAPSIAATDEAPPRSRSASVNSLGSRGPRLGFFNGAVFGPKRTIISDTGGKLPSPFSSITPAPPVVRRKRRANSDLGSFFFKRTRNSQSLTSSYFSDDLFTASQGQLVDLDELLDASLLSEDVDKPTDTDTANESPSRWDRIPMGIYRQTRDIEASHPGSSMSFSFSIAGFGAPALPRPDFVPPARSHVSHGSIDSILWDDDIIAPRRTQNHTHNKKRPRDFLDSDGLFGLSRVGSSRGDRTPTQSRGFSMDPPSDFLSEAKSRKDRRKEKKREKASLQKQILSALDETFADTYDDEDLMMAEAKV